MSDIDIADTTSSQRATFYVPTYESIVGLGQTYTGSGTTLTQTGFSMTTTRHVFVRAAKAATVQAHGDVWAQSLSSSTYALAGNSSYFVA
ncbi:MAG: hypothetical protein AB8I08_07385 [Sandaracinaceae bacterium]